MYPHQAERLGDALERADADVLVATSPENVAYITGFRSLTEAVFHTPQYGIFSRRGTALVVPAIDPATAVAEGVEVDHVVCFGGFRAQAPERPDAEVKRVLDIIAKPAVAPADALTAALAALGIQRGTIGLDESRLTHEDWQRLADRFGDFKVVSAGQALLAARRVKGPYEIECLDRALRIAEEALNAVIQALDTGMTEREAATLYSQEVLKRHATPTPALVAMGGGTAIPAPWPGDRALRRGDLVRMDVGCVSRGYHGSLARMAVMGDPAPRPGAAYRAIQAGLEAALAAVRPGVPARRVYQAAVEAVRGAGLPRYDRNHVGHGIGLEAYERPKLAGAIETPLETGEVLRVETPYYELGWAGLNVRETVIVTTTGARGLNRSARSLIVLD